MEYSTEILMMKNSLLAVVSLLLVILMSLSLAASLPKQPEHLVAVAVNKSHTEHLYFRGVLSPIKTISVINPVDARIVAMDFSYGQQTQQGDVLLRLDANSLGVNYRSALSEYLQKKAELQSSRAKFFGDRELFNAGVIAKQDFDSSRNHYATSLMNLTQSRFALEKVLATMHIDSVDLEKLSLQDNQLVLDALQRNLSNFVIRSPADGVVLIPAANNGRAESPSLRVGAHLKAGQAILSVGDMSGLSIRIQVSELVVLKIKKGLKVTVTGDAFPGVQLQGVVSRVAAQANPSHTSGSINALSMYDVVVDVPAISAQDRQKILIGMTAKVDIAIRQADTIMVPIDAVSVKEDGRTTVTILDKHTQKEREVVVETGDTTPTQVTILEGLKAGDTVLRHPALVL